MAQVNYTSKRLNMINGEDEGEMPIQIVETLRDKIFKKCLEKQMKTDISLKEQKCRERNFVKGVSEDSITNNISGLITLNDLNTNIHLNNVKQILKSSGLDSKDINILLRENTCSSSNEAPIAEVKRLESILEQLNKRIDYVDQLSIGTESFNGAIELSRNEYEEECILTSSAISDKLTNCLVKMKPRNNCTIYNEKLTEKLHEIEKSLMSSVESVSESGNIMKKQKVNNVPNVTIKKTENPDSLWDVMNLPKVKTCEFKTNSNMKFEDHVYKCSEKKISKKTKIKETDLSKPFVMILDSSKLIPLNVINSRKICLNDIKQIEKFKNYNPGEINSTLYLKNLPNKMTSEEIASIFGHFECKNGPHINYRILSGRMRGQAFVAFAENKYAELAFQNCNGFIFKDKPIIIEYGKNVK